MSKEVHVNWQYSVTQVRFLYMMCPNLQQTLSCVYVTDHNCLSLLLIGMYILYVGESGLVYKGYIDTSVGSELVAVKTGKGIRNCAGLDCVKTWHVCTL